MDCWRTAATSLALLGLLALPGDAFAQELGLRVLADSAFASGTHLRPAADGAHIDFGSVSNLGAAPRNGRREPAEGGAYYVATFELQVVPVDGLRGPMLPGRTGVGKTSLMLPREKLGGRRVVLFASLVDPDIKGDVRVSVGRTADWGAGDAFSLGPGEVPLAFDLAAGDRIRCELAMFASDGDFGLREAAVHFEVR